MKIKSTLRRLRRLDYRHYICFAITLGFFACGFIFPNALPRLAETVRDLGLSIAYYFCELVTDVNPIRVTVTDMPSWQFAPLHFEPLKLLPSTWEEFQALWGEYWRTWATWDTVEGYFAFLGDIMYYLSKGLLFLTMLIPLLWVFVGRYLVRKEKTNGAKTKCLVVAEKFLFKVIRPVIRWFREFFSFVSKTRYKPFWIFLWLLYFNVLSLVVAFLAYYLYLISSYDMLSIYGQCLKLMVDLAPVVRFVPGVIWAIIGFKILNKICISYAKGELNHALNKIRGFIKKLGVLAIICGRMGTGKTTMLTTMALVYEVQMRDDALEIILERDIMFPNFPWFRLEDEIKKRMETKQIVDVDSIKRWLGEWRPKFERLKPEWCKWWRRQVRERGFEDVSFGYDFEHYAIDYNDELKISTLYEVIEEYACAYYIYAIQTSLIISNYSIRSDEIIEDFGHFPIWNHDFFERDPRLMDAYSRHSHIIDYDMLRLGTRMVEENPNRNAFGFGVYGFSEIDKERKNMLALKETKVKDEECNQRNDLFEVFLKMSRHKCVIANRVFLKILCDLQRPEDWSAGGREVGEVVFIEEKGEMVPLLPFFSPFWLCEGVFKWVYKKYNDFNLKYKCGRDDVTLFFYLVRNLMSKIENHYRKINNGLGCQEVSVETESGRMDGKVEKHKFYYMPKLIYSKRNATDCLNSIFEGDEPNKVSIADLPEYKGYKATYEELAMQNSHFQADVRKWKGKAS